MTRVWDQDAVPSIGSGEPSSSRCFAVLGVLDVRDARSPTAEMAATCRHTVGREENAVTLDEPSRLQPAITPRQRVAPAYRMSNAPAQHGAEVLRRIAVLPGRDIQGCSSGRPGGAAIYDRSPDAAAASRIRQAMRTNT